MTDNMAQNRNQNGAQTKVQQKTQNREQVKMAQGGTYKFDLSGAGGNDGGTGRHAVETRSQTYLEAIKVLDVLNSNDEKIMDRVKEIVGAETVDALKELSTEEAMEVLRSTFVEELDRVREQEAREAEARAAKAEAERKEAERKAAEAERLAKEKADREAAERAEKLRQEAAQKQQQVKFASSENKLEGILTKCYICGCEVHTIDRTWRIIEHYRDTDKLGERMEVGRKFWRKNKLCNCVEVYTYGIKLIDRNGQVTTIYE